MSSLRSDTSALLLGGLPNDFRDCKPPAAPASSRRKCNNKKVSRKKKNNHTLGLVAHKKKKSTSQGTAPKVLRWHGLKVDCFIDNAWHRATVKDGPTSFFLPGNWYTVKFDEDGYVEKYQHGVGMRVAA